MDFARAANRSEPVALALALVSIAAAWILPYPGSLSRITWTALIIVIAVLLHEVAHRQVARKSGCYSRFILDPMGFTITLLSAALPIKFLAPGYVGISCPYYVSSPEVEFRITAAGPLTNLLLATAAAAALVIGAHPRWIWGEAEALNSWLALFNLLPLGPLDGAKIMRTAPAAWAAMFAWAALLMFYP